MAASRLYPIPIAALIASLTLFPLSACSPQPEDDSPDAADTSITVIDDPRGGDSEEERQCEAGSYRCGEEGTRQMCDGDADAYIPSPCPTDQVCQGEGTCVPACQANPEIPCTHTLFSSPAELPHTPACLGAAIAIDEEGYVAIGDPCADPPMSEELFAEGAVLVATASEDGALTHSHVIDRGEEQPSEGAPWRREAGDTVGRLIYVPDFRSPAPSRPPCTYNGRLIEQSQRGGVITLEAFGMALIFDPLAAGLSGQDGPGAAWLVGAFTDPHCEPPDGPRGATQFYRYTLQTAGSGFDAGQAVALEGEQRGENRHITFYVSVPGGREGMGVVRIISLGITPDDTVFSQVDDGIDPVEGNVRLGEAIALGKEHVYVSAPSSPSIDHHLGWAPHVGSGPPRFYQASALGLTGYRLGDRMVTCNDQLFVLATGREEDSELNPLLLRFREDKEEGPVYMGTLMLERYLPGLTPSWRAGEALACEDTLLLVGAPGAPDGGKVLSLTFHKGRQE